MRRGVHGLQDKVPSRWRKFHGGEDFHGEEESGTPVVQVPRQRCGRSQLPAALLRCWASLAIA